MRFTYHTHHLSPELGGRSPWVDIDTVRRKVRDWANRRAYPISWQVRDEGVIIDIEAPTTAEHNRAVTSLCRILSKHETLSYYLT